MIKETMTLRAALGQKKLLDKQITDASVTKSFCMTIDKSVEIVDCMPIDEWDKDAIARWQSLNDKIARRNAIALAILDANTKNTIELPKFTSLLDINSGETEKVSFAAAIARKNYYNNELSRITDNIRSFINRASSEVRSKTKAVDEYIVNRLNAEFGNTTNASSAQRSAREEELRKQYAISFHDPAKVGVKIRDVSNAINEYIANIDALLGHATEVTEITIEY